MFVLKHRKWLFVNVLDKFLGVSEYLFISRIDMALIKDWLGKMIFIITNDTPWMSSE